MALVSFRTEPHSRGRPRVEPSQSEMIAAAPHQNLLNRTLVAIGTKSRFAAAQQTVAIGGKADMADGVRNTLMTRMGVKRTKLGSERSGHGRSLQVQKRLWHHRVNALVAVHELRHAKIAGQAHEGIGICG